MPGQFDAAVTAHGTFEYLGRPHLPHDVSHVVECNCSNPDGTEDSRAVLFSGGTRAEAVEAWVEHVLAETVAAAHAELDEINTRLDLLRSGGSVPPPMTTGPM